MYDKKKLKEVLKELLPDTNVMKEQVNSFYNFINLIKEGGFTDNRKQINPGRNTSNTGDAMEAMFIGRAILYGYDPSQSESRVTGYDVVVDNQGTLYRVQVKGVEYDPASFDLKDRDRGGRGIDQHHESNKGKAIGTDRADILALVDKKTALCWLIPLWWCEKLRLDSLSREDMLQFKEEWRVFDSNFNHELLDTLELIDLENKNGVPEAQ